MAYSCPRCGAAEHFQIDDVRIPEMDSSNGMHSFALFSHYGPSGEQGFFGEKNTRTTAWAMARVCASCGTTELYTTDLPVLEKLAAARVPGIRKITGS